MAPVPDDGNHYDGGSPLDGGNSPSTLAGGNTNPSPTPLEIGLIVGVVSLVIVSVIWLFFWRSRRIRASKNARTEPTATATGYEEELRDANDLRIPLPLPKDDRASIGENDEVSSIKPPCRSHRRPMMNWTHSPQSSQAHQVEEHEMPSRV
ncbi:hypothetical protein F5Y19DRAFT_477122 [Xylariaceae sp. FL1651]|nr:hypothetical protein F5Y19DRAFT_477122 [Xylariaceae sp. FL1651]